MSGFWGEIMVVKIFFKVLPVCAGQILNRRILPSGNGHLARAIFW